MNAMLHWMGQMDGVLGGWWMGNMSQQGCSVSEVVVGVMYQAGIVGRNIAGPFMMPEDVKMSASK